MWPKQYFATYFPTQVSSIPETITTFARVETLLGASEQAILLKEPSCLSRIFSLFPHRV
jgi:hypothetical protein